MTKPVIPKIQILRRNLTFVTCASVIVLITTCWYFLLPNPLFNKPYSSLLTDSHGQIISARIAKDNQWRFPVNYTNASPKLISALVTFEDKNFFFHKGVDWIALGRALYQNIKYGKTVSGGSTITMQVARMALENKKRTIFNKIREIILALRIEYSYSKLEILSLYFAHAPFGRNIVGAETASYRYFNQSANELTWAEAATLAVLPNAPALIFPGKNQQKLLSKRNKLLQALKNRSAISQEIYMLSLVEPLPQKTFAMPDMAPHLLNRSIKEFGEGKRFQSSLNSELQKQIQNLLQRQATYLNANQIYNSGVLVAEVNSGKIIAYNGNITYPDRHESHGENVDVVNAPRSTGSILKPFLYGYMINEGLILPTMLIPDIPTQIAGFNPKNFNLSYDGAVQARQALARSLNIPAVRMLQQYGYEKFKEKLLRLGLKTINRPADHYGLSLVLGGAEAKLYDLCGAYAALGRILNNFNLHHSYNENQYHPLTWLQDQSSTDFSSDKEQIKAGAIYEMFNAMLEVSRPDIDANWKRLSGSQKIAWKTGTSYGYRDAWAIGITKNYVVGVWVGNASGEGRPELTGIASAAPILFEVFALLPKSNDWFAAPQSELHQIEICKKSGHRAGQYCSEKSVLAIQKTTDQTRVCPYHLLIHLDEEKKYQVNSDCYPVNKIINETWFNLPPGMEYYYKSRDPEYKSLPPWKPECTKSGGKSMEMIYPKHKAKLFIPKDLGGKPSQVVFELAHQKPETKVYWHLDQTFISYTEKIHQLALNPSKGQHTLTLVDDFGETITIQFEIINEQEK